MNINIIISRLEATVRALTTLNDDGSYTILVNKMLCRDKMIEALTHEIKHIQGDDMYSDEHTELIEKMLRESTDGVDISGYNFYYHVI